MINQRDVDAVKWTSQVSERVSLEKYIEEQKKYRSVEIEAMMEAKYCNLQSVSTMPAFFSDQPLKKCSVAARCLYLAFVKKNNDRDGYPVVRERVAKDLKATFTTAMETRLCLAKILV